MSIFDEIDTHPLLKNFIALNEPIFILWTKLVGYFVIFLLCLILELNGKFL